MRKIPNERALFSAHSRLGTALPIYLFANAYYPQRGYKAVTFFPRTSKGCSIQRESIAKNVELAIFVTAFLHQKNDRGWIGVVTSWCNDVRKIHVGDNGKRAVCVYDTANLGNPAHGEMFQTQYVIEEADAPELRAKLFEAFDKNNPIMPKDYRRGVIWSQLSRDLQERPTRPIK